MNKRDEFAMAAMQAIISKNASKNFQTEQECADNSVGAARGAYFYTNTMLKVGGWNSVLSLEEVEAILDAEKVGHPCKGGCEACVGCNASESNYEGSDKKAFQPFNLQVENQETADFLTSLVGATGTKEDKAFGVEDTAYQLYAFLLQYASENRPKLTTNLL